VLVSTGTYHELFIRVIYTEWIFFGLLAVGLMRLRNRPGLVREYKIWGYPWVPIIFAVSAFGIVANQIVSDPRESVIGLGMVLIGLPVYAIWGRKGLRTDPRP
jgi:APA family basic amino acid/polyamine antiporter